MSNLQMVRFCAEQGCNYATTRDFNLRRHLSKVHHIHDLHPAMDKYGDSILLSSSDGEPDEQAVAKSSRTVVLRSTVQTVQHKPADMTAVYQEAGELVFGWGPAANAAMLTQELTTRFGFSKCIAEAIAVSSKSSDGQILC